MDKDVPCYGCERREPLCHSSCEAYKAYKQKREDKAKVIREQRANEAMMTDVQIRSVKRMTKDKSISKQIAWRK